MGNKKKLKPKWHKRKFTSYTKHEIEERVLLSRKFLPTFIFTFNLKSQFILVCGWAPRKIVSVPFLSYMTDILSINSRISNDHKVPCP